VQKYVSEQIMTDKQTEEQTKIQLTKTKELNDNWPFVILGFPFKPLM
jgi:hypothetical protein